MKSCTLIEYNTKITDNIRGNLFVIEKENIPFTPKRVFWISRVPKLTMRGGHSHKICHQFLICVSGSIEINIDKNEVMKVNLNENSKHGVFIPAGHWIETRFIRPKSILVVLASEDYKESDYIKDYEQHKKLFCPIQ